MRLRYFAPALAALALATTLGVEDARAETNVPRSPSGPAKGITAGALLGAEAVLLVQAAIDVEPAWAYIVGGAAGAAAGGVGGYFLEKEIEPKTSMLLLAGGMLLIIPTVVAVASARAYEPPADYVEDTGPTDVPIANPPAPEAAPMPPPGPEAAPPPPAPETTPLPPAPAGTGATEGPGTKLRKKPVRRLRSKPLPELYGAVAPSALIGVNEQLLSLHVPDVVVRDVYTTAELRQYGISQETEVRIPLVSYSF